MLSERVRKALSAYAEGEAPPHLCRAVLRLVRQSEEARAYLEKLPQDRQRLRALPAKHPPADFADQLLRTIAERRLSPRRAQPQRPQPRRVFPAWVGVAAAAAVLLTVGAGSYFYFA